MRRAILAILAPCAAVLLLIRFAQPQPRRPVAQRPPATDAISFRVVFGYQRTAVKTYDGSVTVSGGTLRGIEPWRFLQNDAITGPDSWKLEIRRVIFENQPDQPQSMAGGGPATM